MKKRIPAKLPGVQQGFGDDCGKDGQAAAEQTGQIDDCGPMIGFSWPSFGLSQKKNWKKPAQNRTSKLKNRIMFDACHAYCSRKFEEKKQNSAFFENWNQRKKIP